MPLIDELEAQRARIREAVDAAQAGLEARGGVPDRVLVAARGAILSALEHERRAVARWAAAGEHGGAAPAAASRARFPLFASPQAGSGAAAALRSPWGPLSSAKVLRSSAVGGAGAGAAPSAGPEWERAVLLATRELFLERLRAYAVSDLSLRPEDLPALELLRGDVHSLNAALLAMQREAEV